MASCSTKKKREDEVIEQNSDDDSSSEEESENSESDIDPDLEIQVEFEARTPTASDFAGIKRLLQQLLLKANINLSEVTDLILKQSKVGSVIKCVAEGDDDNDDEDETYGITTVLNLRHHKEVASVRDFLQLITSNCEDEKFLKIFKDPQYTVGWLISERFINIPPHIAPPLYASLSSEISKASKKGKPFEFDYILYMCKSCKLDVSVTSKKKRKSLQEENAGLMFINAEDELTYQKAEVTFDYDVTEQSDVLVMGKWQENDSQMRSCRTVMLIPWKDMETVITEMEQFTM